MFMDSLWGEDFALPNEKEKVKKIKEKITSTKKEVAVSVEKQLKSSKILIEDKLQLINTEVYRVLGKQADNIIVIRDIDTLHKYVDTAITNNIIAIDTETNNSLDPITCKLMGVCLYTKNAKQTYIPINHRNPQTQERLTNQLTEQDIANELNRLLIAKTYTVMHNGKFDYEVLKCTTSIAPNIDWDTLIGAKLLDENEASAGLKDQYIKKIDSEQEKYSIDHLFNGVEYADVDPDVFALYAATDAMMTYKLYQYQMQCFENTDLRKVFNLATSIEMPLVKVIAEMELRGMEVDMIYAQRLSDKYHNKLAKIDAQIDKALSQLQDTIANWRLTPDANLKVVMGRTTTINKIQYKYKSVSPSDGYWYVASTEKRLSAQEALDIGLNVSEQKSKAEQLTTPINLGSPTQLAILFYDILKAPVVSKDSPRATGEDALKEIAKKIDSPLCSLITERRELLKLLSTYIDSIPELAKRWKDHRVRTHFNQYGAATGRLSSSDPLNFQNIPSHNKEIRKIFKAKDGYRIVGADYSAQEPRITAYLSQDPSMIKAYTEEKDLYSVIAAMSFGRKYEDCLEFYPEGTEVVVDGKKVIAGHKNIQNKEGKQYRTMAKSILLGIEYGRGAASVGEQIGKSKEEAEEIINKFFTAFPKVKQWINESIQSAHTLGYVEDVAGRRRRLPDAKLADYEITLANNKNKILFNPFLGCSDVIPQVEKPLYDKYMKKCTACRGNKELEKIKAEALKENVEIRNNKGFIAQAERQAVNARVQGSAATLTKAALIRIYYDERLRKCGAYLINTVHDEILIEVPKKMSEEAEKYLIDDMLQSAKDWVSNVPMSADTYNVSHWYEDEYQVTVDKEVKDMLDKGISVADAFMKECENRQESTPNQLYDILRGTLGSYVPDNVNL